MRSLPASCATSCSTSACSGWGRELQSQVRQPPPWSRQLQLQHLCTSQVRRLSTPRPRPHSSSTSCGRSSCTSIPLGQPRTPTHSTKESRSCQRHCTLFLAPLCGSGASDGPSSNELKRMSRARPVCAMLAAPSSATRIASAACASHAVYRRTRMIPRPCAALRIRILRLPRPRRNRLLRMRTRAEQSNYFQHFRPHPLFEYTVTSIV